MFTEFRHRSYRLEHIDTGDYSPEEYEGCIAELQLVNKWLGDASALRKSLLHEIERNRLERVSILDVGAGSGELLRIAVKWCRETGRRVQATGLELNARSAYSIMEESARFSEINSIRGNALQLPFRDGAIDYVISSLFTHHFSNYDVVAILREMARVAARGVYVIDLHRHPVPYFFYTTIGKLFLHNRLIREDGALSILRSFKPSELRELAQHAGLQNIEVQRHFPYRLVLASAVNRLEEFPITNEVRSDQAA